MKPLAGRSRPGFGHIARYRTADGTPVAKILPGELYVTEPPELITTLLGSCVAACMRDPVFQVGGMNHFMLPDSPDEGDVSMSGGRYGAFAMEELINELIKAGGSRDRLEVKIFGGGNIGTSKATIGQQNATFVERYLSREGFRVVARDLGGPTGRKVIYDPGTGRAQVLKLPPLALTPVAEQEARYRRGLKKRNLGGSVELFD